MNLGSILKQAQSLIGGGGLNPLGGLMGGGNNAGLGAGGIVGIGNKQTITIATQTSEDTVLGNNAKLNLGTMPGNDDAVMAAINAFGKALGESTPPPRSAIDKNTLLILAIGAAIVAAIFLFRKK
jgi:hypothetical protein